MTPSIAGLRITPVYSAPQTTPGNTGNNAATQVASTLPSTTVSLGQTTRNDDASTYSARGTLAASTRYALEQDSTDKLSIALLAGVQSSGNNARFQGVGAALLEQLVSKGGQAVSQSVFTYAEATQPSAAALALRADKLRQEPTNAISLTLTTASGATVRLSLASSDDGLAVSAEVQDGELDANQLKGLASLADSFQAAINGLTQEPPALKLGNLVKLDPALFTSLKLDANLQTSSGEPQRFALDISDTARSLSLDGPSGNLKLNLDTRNASLLGNDAQRQAAVRNYLSQFDAAQQRGHGDKEQMSLFKDAFVQLNSADDGKASTSGAVLAGNDRMLLSGLADFTASIGKTAQSVNPLLPAETDRFNYEVSQATTVNGTALSTRSVQQDQQSRLSAAWHQGVNPQVPLILGTDFKSQNYSYHEVDDRASASTRLGYNKDNKLVEASASQQASQNERVRTYVDGVLSDDVSTPRSAAQSRNLLGMLEDVLQRERISLRDRGVSLLEAQLTDKRSDWLLQADPAGIRR